MDSSTSDGDPSPPTTSSRSPLGTRVRHVVSLAVLAAACLAFAVFFYQVVRPLALPLFLAAVFAMLAFPLHERLTATCGGRGWLSALMILSSLLVVLVVPSIAGFLASYQRAVDAVDLLQRSTFDTSQTDRLLSRVARLTRTDPEAMHARIIQAASIGERLLYQRAFQAIGDLFSFGLALAFFLISAFFFLRDGQAIATAWDRLTPLDLEQDRKVRRKFADLCRGVVLSTILAALAQTLAVGLGLALLDRAFGLDLGRWIPLLLALTAVCSMLPVLGATAAWLPLALWLLYQRHYAAGILLVILGAVVVSNVDNLIRMRVMKGAAGMHPLLTLISVLGGVRLMGVIGAFIGPIVAGVFVALLLILKQQLDEIEGPLPPAPDQDNALLTSEAPPP